MSQHVKTGRPRPLSVRALALLALAGFFLGGGAGVAYANSYSDRRIYATSSTACYEQRAATINVASGGTLRSGQVQNWGLKSSCFAANGTAYIGAAAFVKKSNGATCSTASTVYVQSSYQFRSALYSSSACGTGQLQGSGTTYGYTGAGYSSASIAAPYQSF